MCVHACACVREKERRGERERERERERETREPPEDFRARALRVGDSGNCVAFGPFIDLQQHSPQSNE